MRTGAMLVALLATLVGFGSESSAQDRPRPSATLCPNRFADGPLNCTLPDGRGIIGRIVNGKTYGNVQMTFTNGDWFVGLLADGRPNGHGRYYYASGARYEGQFANGARSGPGAMAWPNGNRFQGEFRNNQPNGFGIFSAARGEFRGNWVNGCLPSHRIAIDKSPAECGF